MTDLRTVPEVYYLIAKYFLLLLFNLVNIRFMYKEIANGVRKKINQFNLFRLWIWLAEQRSRVPFRPGMFEIDQSHLYSVYLREQPCPKLWGHYQLQFNSIFVGSVQSTKTLHCLHWKNNPVAKFQQNYITLLFAHFMLSEMSSKWCKKCHQFYPKQMNINVEIIIIMLTVRIEAFTTMIDCNNELNCT